MAVAFRLAAFAAVVAVAVVDMFVGSHDVYLLGASVEKMLWMYR